MDICRLIYYIREEFISNFILSRCVYIVAVENGGWSCEKKCPFFWDARTLQVSYEWNSTVDPSFFHWASRIIFGPRREIRWSITVRGIFTPPPATSRVLHQQQQHYTILCVIHFSHFFIIFLEGPWASLYIYGCSRCGIAIVTRAKNEGLHNGVKGK